MTQKQIQTTLLDRLESVDLRGTLLFGQAKSSKNFCKDSHFVRIYFLDTSLHCVPLSMTNVGVDSHNNDKFWIASLFRYCSNYLAMTARGVDLRKGW